ncbi:tRNA (adenosine(37)-N6)-threonylcarbamoyltransferase complex ATPase subunit type 1 TsaE [Gaetbulibacter sp. M240]|uniref:tRNA (adenosine(37)-N6)-threonylcarbamoyltransferase complex ATPase subunit type 1 TsaE n=1 Tax=Gaetbulibacter sp. M240 TaxID=3126511 RepID=UPI00374F4FA9
MREPKLDITFKLSEIEYVAAEILKNLTDKVVLFYGDMGSGKTTLIKELISALGCEDEVNSPTFSIVNEYALTDGKIFHFDLYRIEDEEEALNFGIEDYFEADAWVFVEWPQIIESMIPHPFHSIKLTNESVFERRLILE